MVKIYKFPNKSNKSKKYSKEFLKKIDPNAIGDFIKEKNPQEFETNSHEQFLWNHDPKKTLH